MDLYYFGSGSLYGSAFLYSAEDYDHKSLEELVVELDRSCTETLESNRNIILLESATVYENLVIRANNFSIETMIEKWAGNDYVDQSSFSNTKFIGTATAELENDTSQNKQSILVSPSGPVNSISFQLLDSNIEHPRVMTEFGGCYLKSVVNIIINLPHDIFLKLYQSPHSVKEVELTLMKGSSQRWFFIRSPFNLGKMRSSEIIVANSYSKLSADEIKQYEFESKFFIKIKQ